MDHEQNDRQRITWTTRINVRPASRDMIRTLAREERMPVATVIGMAIETYVTARSTA
jgi:hypothetical protein